MEGSGLDNHHQVYPKKKKKDGGGRPGERESLCQLFTKKREREREHTPSMVAMFG